MFPVNQVWSKTLEAKRQVYSIYERKEVPTILLKTQSIIDQPNNKLWTIAEEARA
jgi:hypothetical protein